MSLKARLITGLLTLVLLAAGIFLIGLYLDLIDVSGTGLEQWEGRSETGIAGGVVLVLALVLGLVSISRRSAEKGSGAGKSRYIMRYNEIGEVRISFDAVENMILKVSRQTKGIRETETKVEASEQGLLVFIKVKIMPDLPIPDLAGELQTRVKEYLEELTGTVVAEVKVLVENIVTEQFIPRKK